MIVGKKLNHSDHDQALTTLFETARKCNVQLNYEKLQYKKQEVDFFSETYTTGGHKPDKNKATAITKMPAPTDKKQVQSFLGMINYLSKFSVRLSEIGSKFSVRLSEIGSKFSVRLSEIVELLRESAKDKVPFNWGPEHQSASTQIKQEVVSAPILVYYNPKKQTVLQTDASIKG